MIVLIYNNRTGQMERFERGERDPMPYANNTMRVGEFRGQSRSELVWSTSRTMEAWVSLRNSWGRPIYVPYAFRRIGEGGHAGQSQHYAGCAFDCAQNLTNALRAQLRRMAQESGLWSYVEPAYLTPTWVHFDARTGPPACSSGYPMLRQGNRIVYVCILQDALNLVTGAGLAIDGIFGAATAEAVSYFQATSGLTADAIVGCSTWQRLTSRANGILR